MQPFLHYFRLLRYAIGFVLLGCGPGNSPPKKDTGHPEPVPTSRPHIPRFDGERAFGYLKRIVSFGPRNPNSPGHEQCRNFIVTTLQERADEVRVQPFTHRGYGNEELRLSNVIASFNPKSNERILLSTHWDTRPRAERDRNHTRWDEPILGANDGASGVAVLMELASMFKSQQPPIGVDLVFFDGEDYGVEGDTPNYLLGSRYFARTKPSTYNPEFGILLDMVGDANLEIPKEGHSVQFAPDIVELVWQTAADLGYTQFVNLQGEAITDDHLPLNEVGIKTINLIDFSYPDDSHRFWHTHEDTPDKCSPASLEAVGTVVAHVVYRQD